MHSSFKTDFSGKVNKFNILGLPKLLTELNKEKYNNKVNIILPHILELINIIRIGEDALEKLSLFYIIEGKLNECILKYYSIHKIDLFTGLSVEYKEQPVEYKEQPVEYKEQPVKLGRSRLNPDIYISKLIIEDDLKKSV